VLNSNGYPASVDGVIAVEIPDPPGALKAVLKPLKEENINALYFCTLLGRGESGQPIVIIGAGRGNPYALFIGGDSSMAYSFLRGIGQKAREPRL